MTGLEGLPAWLDDRAHGHLFSGVVLAQRGDETLFEHAAGLAHRGHRVPITIDTRFQIASVGKMITAATALTMVEEGSLSLDRPITEFLLSSSRGASMIATRSTTSSLIRRGCPTTSTMRTRRRHRS